MARAEQVVEPRNDIVHNLWPMQDNGELFGWRPDRDKAVRDGRSTTTVITLDDVKRQILDLVALILDWQSLYPRVAERARPETD